MGEVPDPSVLELGDHLPRAPAAPAPSLKQNHTASRYHQQLVFERVAEIELRRLIPCAIFSALVAPAPITSVFVIFGKCTACHRENQARQKDHTEHSH